MKLRNAAAVSLLLAVQVVGLGGCGGGSYAQDHQSSPPPPPPGHSISSISPTSASAGRADLNLTITGTNLEATGNQTSSYVVWSMNGTDTSLSMKIVSDTQLSAVIPAALLRDPITAQVRVEAIHKADDFPAWVTNPVSFSVHAAAPTTSAVSPTLV